MAGSETGDTAIVLYLGAVTDEQIEALMEAVADLCIDRGLAVADDEDDVRALVGLRPELVVPDFDDQDAVKEFLGMHSQFLIPAVPGDA